MENNNIRQNIHTNSKREKKKYRYNDSLRKYKKENPNLVKKQKILMTHENTEDLPLKDVGKDISNISSQINENNNLLNYNKFRRHELYQKYRNKTSRSMPKYHFLKASTPRRDFNFRKKNLYLNSNNFNKTTYYKTTDDFNNAYEFETKNKISHIQRPSFTITNRNYSNYRIPKIEYNLTMNRSNYIIDNEKYKELNNLNNILNKHNKELRQESSQMNKEINELRNINQKLYIENKNALIKLEKIKKELDIKNDALNELNIKNKKIRELSEELKKLKNFLKEKENENIKK